MLNVKINGMYRLEALDRNNLVLMRLEEISGKNNETRMEYKNVGFYGRDLKKVIKALLVREVMESDVKDLDSLIKIIEGHIAAINYDSIVKGFMDRIDELENENAALKREKKNG